jgi:hypothetical protein
LVSSQAILKYGIRIAFTHDTKPKIKNNNPMIRIEIIESRLVRELTSTVAAIFLLVISVYALIVGERRAAEDLSR